MESEGSDPLENYSKIIPDNMSTFTFTQVSMCQLRATIRTMRSTGSSGEDDLSIKSVKQAINQLAPLLLHMVNCTISKTTYPDTMKTTKIVPIPKSGKDPSSSDGWRPVNVVGALSKIVEKIFLSQILGHLERNGVISHHHHGSVKGRSTQTLINELHDALVDNLNTGVDTALLILDQSKAYDVVDHHILLQKLKLLGFSNQALKILTSFLTERRQFVQIQGRRSEKLTMSPNSVIQGSTLSCTLFLIYILDMPQIFHTAPHKPEDDRNCSRPSLKTFVDDAITIIKKEPNHRNIKEAITQTMAELTTYMKNNKLALNPDKSQIMIWSRDPEQRRHFEIELEGKTIRHQSEATILGNLIFRQINLGRPHQQKTDTIIKEQGQNLQSSSKVHVKWIQSKICKCNL